MIQITGQWILAFSKPPGRLLWKIVTLMPKQRLHNGEKNNVVNIMKNMSVLTWSASAEEIIIYLAFQKGFDNVIHKDHKENRVIMTESWSHD